MEANDQLLMEELNRDEGRKPVLYLDSEGIPTCGVGHNCKAAPLPEGLHFPLDDGEIDQLYVIDMQEVFDDLDRDLPWWRGLSYARQRVLANMTFNLGESKLLGFHITLGDIESGNYAKAADDMLQSKWAKQVGRRAERLSDMMREG